MVAADEERQESKQVEQHGNHRARSSPYPSRQFKHLVAGRSIGEGQPPAHHFGEGQVRSTVKATDIEPAQLPG